MTRLVYDGSFEGFLTCVFEIYERRLQLAEIVRATLFQPLLEEEVLRIAAAANKAERVWSGLKRKISRESRNDVFKTFLSELPDMERHLLEFIGNAFQSPESVEKDFSNRATLYVSQTARKVHREKHRMEAFVRFQRTSDDIYYASIEPDFNVLPLIIKHFKDRYADQHWIIYDRKRAYGIRYHHDSGAVEEIQIKFEENLTGTFLPESAVAEEEPHYQQLWQQYFSSVNISPRKNTKLHVRHVPLRYWRYLTEKRNK
ncbi:MAG TPA: TIGR03915 family putative DNA repair protein [Cyclobacteriaceae bacterium]|nr:TIGR03915 family putative DNA repair protein [Cyclobacteriaceae bacterium]HMV08110.1 TIGR03915 family putative DNA repair protein [Cyclobacteriaceae bacterium]HMV88324.1 TIGR03915 family putative DNA repair protein [Cyclobacteriaceae bacterium]HMX00751.1 TIGR03915 family putative DNA repair protein [Cyclobacteriaceae bacterium]HMX49374.1 TIGR03915 family putative DNA repair protein [Cyclobacteriaceae bacterium]